ncbi:MAG: hypothetical protein ACT4N8_01470 [Sphingosinicella sp.]|uniref:hypothetical protein n=1 Tax=Sphingosinicella sp. TaxID=1917971 RepID=UPI0040383C1D
MPSGLFRLAALVFLGLVALAPANAEWRRAESTHFIVYSDIPEARLREHVLLLENFDRLLRLMTTAGREAARTKLQIYIVENNRQLNLVRPVGSDAGGFYTGGADGIAAFVDERTIGSSPEVLLHEYAHHFMLQYAPGAYPAWYVEGFAEYFMTARFRPRGDIEVGNFSRSRGLMLTNFDWLPTDRILFGTSGGLNDIGTGQYYAQSWLLVHYFYSDPARQAALGRYLQALAEGRDAEDALEPAIGMDAGQLHAALRAYARRGIPYRRLTPATSATPATVTITSLPRSAEDLLLYQAALRVGIPEENRDSNLQRIRTIAARHEGDPYARRVLAHAELLYGDAAAAERLIEPLLAASPADAELLYLRGMRHFVDAQKDIDRAANLRRARNWFARAHRADEHHFQSLFRYGQSFRDEPDYTSENNSNVLLLAHQLAPQVPEIRLEAAQVLLRRELYEQAEALLAPLAASQHDPGLAAAGRQLLETARARGRPVTTETPPAGDATRAARDEARPGAD